MIVYGSSGVTAATRSASSAASRVRPRSRSAPKSSIESTSSSLGSRSRTAATSAARPTMSAIVAEPVPWPVVLSCMLLRSSSGTAEEGDATRRRARRDGSRCRYLPGGLQFRAARHEQSLVDTALEDRHAQLHALLDDLATLHASFASELRGREMDCHQCDSS